MKSEIELLQEMMNDPGLRPRLGGISKQDRDGSLVYNTGDAVTADGRVKAIGSQFRQALNSLGDNKRLKAMADRGRISPNSALGSFVDQSVSSTRSARGGGVPGKSSAVALSRLQKMLGSEGKEGKSEDPKVDNQGRAKGFTVLPNNGNLMDGLRSVPGMAHVSDQSGVPMQQMLGEANQKQDIADMLLGRQKETAKNLGFDPTMLGADFSKGTLSAKPMGPAPEPNASQIKANAFADALGTVAKGAGNGLQQMLGFGAAGMGNPLQPPQPTPPPPAQNQIPPGATIGGQQPPQAPQMLGGPPPSPAMPSPTPAPTTPPGAMPQGMPSLQQFAQIVRSRNPNISDAEIQARYQAAGGRV